MQRRLKRFKVKPKYMGNLKIEISLGEHYTHKGAINSISLQSLSFFAKKGFAQHMDKAAKAKITFDGLEIDLGKVFLLKENVLRLEDYTEESRRHIGIDKDSAMFVLRTLQSNIPLEQLMRYLQHQLQSSPYDFELNHGKFTLLNFYRYDGSDDILEKSNLFLTMQRSWKEKHVYQYERYRKSSMGKRVELDRRRPNGTSEYLVFGSNDYLGLASHPSVIERSKAALDTYGFGSTGSPLSTGQTEEHINLQRNLADMFRKEDCLLYNSGFITNIGVLSAICRKGDLVIYDSLSHASIQDGIKMARETGATCLPFKHNDMDNLEELLIEQREKYSGCLIVTEGIFSMDGDIADMSSIVNLAKKYFARTYLDVAHDFGVIGSSGLGAGEHHGVLDQIDIVMGTFSKIAGGIGGFVVGSKALLQYLRYMSRSYMFTVSLPPANVAGVAEALRIFRSERSILDKLKENIRYFVTGLSRLGVDLGPHHVSSICPVIIGDERRLNDMTEILYDHGIFVSPVAFPAVGKKEARFRFTISALHEQTDLDYALLVLEMAFKETKHLENLSCSDDGEEAA